MHAAASADTPPANPRTARKPRATENTSTTANTHNTYAPDTAATMSKGPLPGTENTGEGASL